MRNTRYWRSLGIINLFGVLLTGCGNKAPGTQTPVPEPKITSDFKAHGPAGDFPRVEPAGPFSVKLDADSIPSIKSTRFQAFVRRNDKPVDNAKVLITLLETGSASKSVAAPMKYIVGGEYQYVVKGLDKPGLWHVKITVTSGKETGTADFNVNFVK